MAKHTVNITVEGSQRRSFIEFPDDADQAWLSDGNFDHDFELESGSHRVLIRVTGPKGTEFTLNCASETADVSLFDQVGKAMKLPYKGKTQSSSWELRYGTLKVSEKISEEDDNE